MAPEPDTESGNFPEMGNAKLYTTVRPPTRRVPCLGVLAIRDPHDMDSSGPGHRVCKRCREAAVKRDISPILQKMLRAVDSED